MSAFLRKVQNKNRWMGVEDLAWLPSDDVEADLLADLKTQENELSIWHIEDDRSNLERVLAALAAGCKALDRLDYLLFDSQALDSLGIEYRKSAGDSCDPELNEKFHFDAVRLSGRILVGLARGMKDGAEKARVQASRVKALISWAVGLGHFPIDQVPEGIRAKLAQ